MQPRLPIRGTAVYIWTPVPKPDVNPEEKRNLWQRRVLDPIVAQLTQGITPEKIALTLAVGGAVALFPVLGTTTLLCLVAGVLLRLNQPMIQMVNFLCTPIHIPLIYVFVHWGQVLFHEPRTPFNIRAFAQSLWDDPGAFFHRFGLTVAHAVVVWAIAAPFWVAFIYYTICPILREVARIRAESAIKTLDDAPPDHPIP